jgi:C4-type Zn-finger protein
MSYNANRRFIEGVLDEFKDAIESADDLSEDRAMAQVDEAFTKAADELEDFFEDEKTIAVEGAKNAI